MVEYVVLESGQFWKQLEMETCKCVESKNYFVCRDSSLPSLVYNQHKKLCIKTCIIMYNVSLWKTLKVHLTKISFSLPILTYTSNKSIIDV